MSAPGGEKAFAPAYAQVYDLLYHDKDYGEECDLLERLWSRHAAARPSTVLDLGCGTGGHAVPLARRGYRTSGVDLSSGMVEVARAKARAAGVDADFHVMPMQALDLPGRTFDVITCLFQAINYVTEERDLREVFRRVRRHLNPENGLFLFDFRNGVPSIREFSPVRFKEVRAGNRTLLRLSETTLDPMAQLFRTTYTNTLLEDDRVVERLVDPHVVRFFFPREVRFHLEDLGFEVLAMTAFPEIDRAPTEADWDIMVVAR